MSNNAIARRLFEWAHLLEADHASLYRIRAYRQAAETVLGLDRSVMELDRKSLRKLPGIGRKMSEHITQLVRSN